MIIKVVTIGSSASKLSCFKFKMFVSFWILFKKDNFYHQNFTNIKHILFYSYKLLVVFFT